MQQQLRQILIPVLILAGGAGGYYWLAHSKEAPPRVVAPSLPPLVEAQLAAAHSGSFPIRVHGVVVPYREIRIAAEVSGRIVKKNEAARGGRFVTATTPLLTIDPEPYGLEIEKLDHEAKQAELETQRAELELQHSAKLIELAERRLELARQEVKRLTSTTAEVTSTQAERDEAEQKLLQVQDVLTVLENRREVLPLQLAELQTKAELIASRKRQAQLDLSRTQIIAPLDAIITADLQEAGNFVEPGDHLLTLQDPSQFEVNCRLRSEDLLWLQDSVTADGQDPPANERRLKAALEIPERPATVTFQSGGETFRWQGTLARTDGSGFDATTRTLACRVVVDQPLREEALGPPSLIDGMFVDVEVEVTPRTRLLAIPRAALQPDGQVWIVNDGKLTVHRVQPVRITESIVLLRADRTTIKSGARVVTSTLPIAFDGMDVRERATP
ncbi:MAG: HlyD family efflux transporter periplasmic adaptor subunit [Planctomycetota bacterium]|nr:HlyD family efflux transporter periplasmic adaptor subunit [Planctomycetota bacterium]MDA1249981.1 HlyD family efflux transporter periplasmic adaptor subunit [Planctomycetota bacterium]